MKNCNSASKIALFLRAFLLISPNLVNPPVMADAVSNCHIEVRGTTVPNTSGSPVVINEKTGTIISANFFNSGAIDPGFFDGTNLSVYV